MCKYLFILWFFLMAGLAQSQDRVLFDLSGPPLPKTEYIVLDLLLVECHYQLRFQPDSLNPEHILEEPMVLHLGQKVSSFLNYNRYLISQELKELTSNADFNRILNRSLEPGRSTVFNPHIFKNYPEGKMTTLDRVFMDSFEYEEPLYPYEWRLTGETAQWEGYAVQQALTTYGGREWVAWFAPEIPFSDGPYKFGGLPGLILRLYDTQRHYVFELTSLTPQEVPGEIEVSASRRLRTTRARFWEAERKFREDAVNIVREFLIETPADTPQRIERNMRRRNNPIELTAD
ncbi:MAG: GLPGLI family protein [Bacteroidales bacterium]|nr:GLPGLI family protein [Bacteroidales bacterium]